MTVVRIIAGLVFLAAGLRELALDACQLQQAADRAIASGEEMGETSIAGFVRGLPLLVLGLMVLAA